MVVFKFIEVLEKFKEKNDVSIFTNKDTLYTFPAKVLISNDVVLICLGLGIIQYHRHQTLDTRYYYHS